VPVAIYGVIFFAGALLLILAASFGPQMLRESIPGYLFALSTAGLAVVLYLGYISIAVLKTYCILCLTSDAAVVGLFLVSGAATSFPMTTLPRRAVTDLRAWISSPVAVAVTVLFFGGAVSAVAFFPREGAAAPEAQAAGASQQAASGDQRSEFERWYAAQPRVPIIVPSEGAKVLIVDFSDFQCPYCRQAFVSLKPIVAKYNAQAPNTVRLVLKDYPLDSECNVNVQNGGPHPSACEAAVAVRLAKGRNREDAMEEWLFANQPQMTPDSVKKAAREVGQVTDFDEKYAAQLDLVKGDIAFGKTLGVQATPTLFINGVRIAGVLAPQYLDQAIAIELQRAAK
jgi:protein-disulfide isomerase